MGDGKIRKINTQKWARWEHFKHFYNEAPCTIHMSDDIDVTELKKACEERNLSFYISFVYAVCRTVNSHDEFKMTVVDSPETEFPLPATYDSVNPAHNVFHKDTETYTTTYTLWKDSFSEFYENCLEDIERAKRLNIMSVPCPNNSFEVSCVPWRHFTSAGALSESYTLSPIICFGGYEERGGRFFLPLSIQIHHAAADGFHLARFLNETETNAREIAGEILKIK